jgi:pSer/pThr/pTyr-binding forkhead associated (FHA) protein
MWKLVIEDDEGKRTVVPLTRDDYTIGRKDGNTIRLTERNVSRDHARLAKKLNGGGPETAAFMLEDLTSYNGVYVNGLRVAAAHELVHGDLVQIGDYRIVLQDDAVADVIAPVAGLAADAKATLPTGSQPRASLLMERPNRFVMLAGPTPGAEYPLDKERMTIGRAEEASISVNHNSVSRIHCEVHALGDGRYEIVDKGSSNGVRVNGADLRRGIVEAGDVIELGDVKFKFVGAGQIFRPGATDSQQLAAIGDRAADEIVGGKRSGRVVPLIVFGAVVAIGIPVAWWLTRTPPSTSSSGIAASASTTVSPEMKALADAKKLCIVDGDCDSAHDRLMRDVPASSALRSSADFKSIESRWAASVLERTQSEPDVAKKRAMLDRVAKADTVDPLQRKQAADMIQSLDGVTSTDPNELPMAVAKDAAAPPFDAGAFKYDAGLRPYDSGVAVTATAPTTQPTTTAPATDVDREGQLALTQRNIAKKQLEGKVFSGRASSDEVRLLKALCKELGDHACVDQCRQMLNKPQ